MLIEGAGIRLHNIQIQNRVLVMNELLVVFSDCQSGQSLSHSSPDPLQVVLNLT